MKVRSLLLGGALAAAAFAGVASAAATPGAPAHACFFSRNWDSWHAPNKNTIYFKVNLHDIYQVDLSAGSDLLTWPDTHLVSKVHGPDTICSPIDLDLSVSDGHIKEFLIAKSITKLTPEQVAAIPKKDLP